MCPPRMIRENRRWDSFRIKRHAGLEKNCKLGARTGAFAKAQDKGNLPTLLGAFLSLLTDPNRSLPW